MGHPETREYIFVDGQAMYYLKTCKKCGSDRRYTSNDQCVACNKKAVQTRNKRIKDQKTKEMYARMQMTVPIAQGVKYGKIDKSEAGRS